MLYHNIGDGWSSTGNKHKRAADNGKTRWKTWRYTSRQHQARSNNKDQHPRLSDSPPSILDFSQREPRCICLKPWRHARNRPFGHSARLNVSPSFPPIRQKKWVFTQERDRAIAEEVCKLQEAGFIREVYYPDWLANVVMIEKANGK